MPITGIVMTRIKFIVTLTLLLGMSISLAHGQQSAETSEINFGGETWTLEKYGQAGERNFLGRQAMFLERAQITLKDHKFSQGVIEFDLATEFASGFVGVNFRDNSEGSSEQFYVRFHQSGHPDATQYLARLNNLASWQLHAGPNDATAVELGTNQWITIKIVVENDKADIFVRDMNAPALHIASLRSDINEGAVTFYAFERPETITGAYFSNIRVRPLVEGDSLIGTPREEQAVAESVFKTWQISSPISESKLSSALDLNKVNMESLEWTKAAVEPNGILNIARYVSIDPEADTVLVKLKIQSKTATSRQLNFGYSDRVRIYVNGSQQFYGNAQWRSRDHRFLGTVGLHDAVILHLDAGNNEVIAAVSESFGGWGFIGQIEQRDGLTIDP